MSLKFVKAYPTQPSIKFTKSLAQPAQPAQPAPPAPATSVIPDLSGKYVEEKPSLNFAKRFTGKSRRSKKGKTHGRSKKVKTRRSRR